MSAAGRSAARNPILKLLVLSPLLLSIAASILLLATAPFVWGAADSLGLAAWLPPATALLVGLPVFVISSWGVAAVWGRLSGLFLVDVMGVAVGGTAHWFAAICLVIIAGTIGAEDGFTGLSPASPTTLGIFMLALTASIIGSSLLAGLTMVYVWSITPGATFRVPERSEDEPDFIDDWTRRRRR